MVARSDTPPSLRQLRHTSKGAKQAAENNDRNERNDRTDYSRDDYVEIARFVVRAAYREQCDHRAVVRQAIEGARTDHRDTVHEPRIDTVRARDLHVRIPAVARD